MRGELVDGMLIERHVPIDMNDGLSLIADVFRPANGGRCPVILSYGPYAKGLAFQDGYPPQWNKLVSDFPEVAASSSCRHMNWEVCDPERWVPHGYVCVRVDSRGAGWSPGYMDIFSRRESRDLYECIEWAAGQDWSSGKVGMLGISYYAMNQWLAAAVAPPPLTAIIPWEGAADFYRDVSYHGGIRNDFAANWYPRQVESVQYGVGARGARSRVTGEPVAGPVELSGKERARNRSDYPEMVRVHRFDDEWHRERSASWPDITIPFLSAANWGGQGLHPRGNFAAFVEAASEQKWLEVHGDAHWTHFYTDYGLDLQRRFFDYFLKDADNGWDSQPRVQLNVRHPGERFELRMENEWPLARTRWEKWYLAPDSSGFSTEPLLKVAHVDYDAMGDGVTFSTPPLSEPCEITGPIAAKLFISSSTADADLFLVVRVFDPDDNEVVFMGALDPCTPVAQGWLRASHRELDPERSRPYQPYHPHRKADPLVPGEIYELDVEILPTSIVVPAGYRVALTVRGKDYEYEGPLPAFAHEFYYASRGVGPFTHTSVDDRPPALFDGTVTIHAGARYDSHVLLPVVPPQA